MKKILSLILLWTLISLAPVLLGLPAYLVASLLVRPSTPLERLALFALAFAGVAWTVKLVAQEAIKLVAANAVGSAAKELSLAATDKMAQVAREKLAHDFPLPRMAPGSKLDS